MPLWRFRSAGKDKQLSEVLSPHAVGGISVDTDVHLANRRKLRCSCDSAHTRTLAVRCGWRVRVSGDRVSHFSSPRSSARLKGAGPKMSASGFATTQLHEQGRNIRRADAADACRLADRDGSNMFKFFTCFGTKLDRWPRNRGPMGAACLPSSGIAPPVRAGGQYNRCTLLRSIPARRRRAVPPSSSRLGSRATRSIHDVSGRRRYWKSESPAMRVRLSRSRSRPTCSARDWKTDHRSSSTSPTWRPSSVSRKSALSWRSVRRYSARLVNIRYGSSTPRVTRSSIKTPM